MRGERCGLLTGAEAPIGDVDFLIVGVLRSKVTLPPMTPSASSGWHVFLVALPQAFVPTSRSARPAPRSAEACL